MSTVTASPPQSTLQRALAILYFCAEQPEGVSFSTLKEVAGGIAGTTLSRILTALQVDGDLIKDAESGLYQCGPRFLSAAQHAAGTLSLEAIIEPIVKRVALRTGHSAAYFHWDGDWMFVCAKYEIPENFHYSQIGFRHHPVGHTFFRPIQAYLKKRQLQTIGVEGADEILERIRQDAYYQQVEELRCPILRITAPIFAGSEHRISGAIGITSLDVKLRKKELDAIIEAVTRGADEANQLLLKRE